MHIIQASTEHFVIRAALPPNQALETGELLRAPLYNKGVAIGVIEYMEQVSVADPDFSAYLSDFQQAKNPETQEALRAEIEAVTEAVMTTMHVRAQAAIIAWSDVAEHEFIRKAWFTAAPRLPVVLSEVRALTDAEIAAVAQHNLDHFFSTLFQRLGDRAARVLPHVLHRVLRACSGVSRRAIVTALGDALRMRPGTLPKDLDMLLGGSMALLSSNTLERPSSMTP